MAKLVNSIAGAAAPTVSTDRVARETNPWLALAVICVGFFAILLDTTIVNIAVPTIIGDLRASFDEVLWVINAYLLVYAVLLIPAGRLGDRFGQRNVFAAGLILFTLASAACGLAQDSRQLIGARVLQGRGPGHVWWPERARRDRRTDPGRMDPRQLGLALDFRTQPAGRARRGDRP